MYRIIDGRATGKTSRLLLLAKENDAIIICMNPEDMKRKAYEYGITGLEFVSYTEAVQGNYLRKMYQNLLIDELELFVQYVLRGTNKLIGYTLSNED
jgi:hypothetical protein